MEKNLTSWQLSLNLGLKIKDSKAAIDKDCWQTPPDILEIIEATFEAREIITDPCTLKSNPTNAKKIYTPDENGLSFSNRWQTNAFVNPPYSDPSKWLENINDRLHLGEIKEAIALIPTGALSTKRAAPWVRKAQAICHWEGRIAFINPNNGRKAKNTNFTSSFLYWGKNSDRFLKIFFNYGIVAQIVSLRFQ